MFQVDKAKSQEKRHSVALPVSEYVSSLRKLSLPDCGENLVREGGAQIKKYRNVRNFSGFLYLTPSPSERGFTLSMHQSNTSKRKQKTKNKA